MSTDAASPTAAPVRGPGPAGDLDDAGLIELCFDRGWTDGLPVVPPTRERVLAAAAAAGDPDEVVAVLPPSGAVVTRLLVAANAVMAGCLPDHQAVVEAAVRAVAQPAFNLDRVLTTASSQSPVVLVNGPVSHRLEIGGDGEVLSGRSRSAATIGRALMLTLRNLAAYGHEGVGTSSLGSPASRGFCFTESTAHSPWDSWHADAGLDPASSWVSVFPAESPLVVVEMGRDDPESVLRTICESASVPGTYNAFFRQDLWLVLSPQHAHVFARAGWSRAEVAQGFHERIGLPADRLEGRGLYGYIDELLPPRWLESRSHVRFTESADDVKVLVAGAEFGGYTAVLFGEGRTVTEQVVE